MLFGGDPDDVDHWCNNYIVGEPIAFDSATILYYAVGRG